jgi:aryl-alcohol dehydrogenase-like predicted oxidoreductase
MTLAKRLLSKDGPPVSALGLGCIGMSEFYGRSDRETTLATIAAALEAGVTLLDTGDFYGMGHNEQLLVQALRGGRATAFVQVKFGALSGPDGSFLGFDARPAAVKTALSYSLRRLGTDYIDLYMTGLDPAVPIEDSIGAIGEVVQQGYVRHVGVTNVDAAIIRRAHATHPIMALQCEYSTISRDVKQEILPLCRELGIGITAYGVLGRGLLTGCQGSGDADLRSTYYPRFQGENLTNNQRLVVALAEVAKNEGITAAGGDRIGCEPGRGHHPPGWRASARGLGRPSGAFARRARGDRGSHTAGCGAWKSSHGALMLLDSLRGAVSSKNSVKFCADSMAAKAPRGKSAVSYAISAVSTSPGLAAMAFPNLAPSYTARLAPSPAKGRTTRHPGYAISMGIRQRIEEVFDWPRLAEVCARPDIEGRTA